MKERWPILLRTSIIVVGIAVFLLSSLRGQVVINATGDSTEVVFPRSVPVTARLLNFSPANKILLKVQGDSLAIQAFTQKLPQTILPPLSGIRELRTIPIGSKALLLVIDFWERLPFTFKDSGQPIRMAVADAPYRHRLENWYRRGLYYHKRGELKKALAYYRKVVFQNRKHGNAYFMAGQIRWQWRQYRLAEINFNRALQGATDSVRVYYFLAQLYDQTQRPQKAQQYARLYEDKRVKQAPPVQPPVQKKAAVSPIKLAQKQVDSSKSTDAFSDSVTVAVGESMNSVVDGWWKPRSSITVLLLSFVGIIGMILVYRWRRQQQLWRVRRNLMQKDVRQMPQPQSSPESLARKKEKILALFEDVVKEDVSESVAVRPGATPETPVPASSPEIAEAPALVGAAEEIAPHRQDPTQLARQLNLGVGEIELALLMSSHQVQTNRQNDYRKAILHLRAQNKSIAEIARELNIGRSEVEIVLKLMNMRTS